MKKFVAIIGAGGHAKVCAELLIEAGFEIECFLDVKASGTTILGKPVIYSSDPVRELHLRSIHRIFLAVGSGSIRERLVSEFSCGDFEFVSAISSRAYISKSAKIGRGVAILPGAVVNSDAEIEDFVILNSNSCVEHNSKVGKYVHIAPGAILAGNVTVGNCAFVGAGASVIPGVVIGEGSIVGAGATVIRNVGNFQTVVGTPALPIDRIVLGEL